jgi:hypothetical protein
LWNSYGLKICEKEEYKWKFLFHSYVDFHLHVELKEKIEVQDLLTSPSAVSPADTQRSRTKLSIAIKFQTPTGPILPFILKTEASLSYESCNVTRECVNKQVFNYCRWENTNLNAENKNERNTVYKQTREDTDIHLKCTISVVLPLVPARE